MGKLYTKLTTKQAFKLVTKKKKGKKPTKSNGIDTSKGGKPNDTNKIAETQNIPNNVTTYNDSDNQEPKEVSIEDRKEKCLVKEKLTEKELKFLELHLTEGMPINKAMIIAGYGHVSEVWRYNLAKKIILKHECQAGDHRKIFRIIGAGETAVAMGLLTLAQTAKSEMVRLNAWASLAKVLGLTKEVLEHAEGIQIIINSGTSPTAEDLPAALTLAPPKAPPASSGPITITK